MCTVGFLGDIIGRRKGSMTTVSVMLIGAILLTAQEGTSKQGQLAMCGSSMSTWIDRPRRKGSTTTVSVMLISAILPTAQEARIRAV
jgi:hypothetical protein